MTATTSGPARVVDPVRKLILQHRIRLVVAVTITYNVIEAIIALASGTVASSAALIGFGLDSIVEVFPAAAMAGTSRSTIGRRMTSGCRGVPNPMTHAT